MAERKTKKTPRARSAKAAKSEAKAEAMRTAETAPSAVEPVVAPRSAPKTTTRRNSKPAALGVGGVEPAPSPAAAPLVKSAPAAAPKKPRRPDAPPPTPLAETPLLSPDDVATLGRNMTAVFERSRAVWEEMAARQAAENAPIHLDPFNAATAFAELWRGVLSEPTTLAERTLKLWRDQAEIWRRAAARAAGQTVEPVMAPERGDKRFKDPDWSENAVFDTLKQSYLLLASYLTNTAHEAGDLEERDRRKVEFFTRQFVEAICPTNYFATNPEVLRATIEERGENLLRGMQNLAEDMERGGGDLLIRQTDLDRFKVGENMAVTPGKVIYRNDVMELIQYAPSTAKVQERPLLICPPWINKYYILDLNPQKSFVKWLVDQGHTVFIISWVNPDERHGEKEFVDYIAEGLFDAAARVMDETGAEDMHLASYCIGGTMCASALAYLEAHPEHPLHGRFASATFFTAQTEFSNAGELQLFVDDEQLAIIDEAMASGFLGAEKMQMSFNMLRASDLIWSFVVNNYMLGKQPFPFDLLYWNSDSTRMPGRVHRYYLETFYRDDQLAGGEMRLGETRLDLGALSLPTYHLATREDHIAPAASVYRGVRLMGGSRRFVEAGSGHIAGVVNPPSSGKYQHWVREDGAFPDTVEAWREAADERAGSWWGDWDGWMKRLNGDAELIEARSPGRRHNAICDAPGEFVRVRFDERAVAAQ